MRKNNMTISLLLFFIVVVATILGDAVHVAPIGGANGYPVTNYEFVEDARGEYVFTDISSPVFANQFQQYPHQVISLGITKSVYWLRFHLPYDKLQMANGILEFRNPNIDKLDVFIPVNDTSMASGLRYLAKSVGVSRPAGNREVLDNNWVFSIPAEYQQDQFWYVRLESSSALRLPIAVWPDNSYYTEALLKNFGFGAFYGILLAMFFYNLVIFSVLRDKAYGYYVLYIGFMLLYQFQVHGHVKLCLDIPYQRYNAIFWVWLTGTFLAATYFTHYFLQVENNRFWNKMLAIFVAAALLQGGLGFWGYTFWANQLAHGIGLAGPIAYMAVAIFRLRQGFRPARYYLLAWGVLAAGIIIWVMAAYIPDTFAAVNYLLVATACEAILLSFALSERFKTLRLKEMALTKHMKYYRNLSLTDELTGLYNKRSFTKVIKPQLAEAQQCDEALTLMILDIDYFKMYNDKYGHLQGDQVLIQLAQVLRDILNQSQMAFRYGGEEFIVLLLKTDCQAALQLAECIRARLQAQSFMPANDKVTVTVSIGVAELRPEDTADRLFKRADDALYKAKAAGRNQVVCL